MNRLCNFYIKLEKSIGKKRFEHSLRVMETAIELSRIYKINKDKVEVAALLHDCGRLINDNLIKKCDELNIALDYYLINNNNLIHAYLGVEIAKREYNIFDKDILNAIKYHTTGRAKMTMIEKIIYISDYIEPNRNFNGVDKIRELAFNDINKAILLSMNNTINHVINKGEVIHLDTVKGRNYILTNNGRFKDE